MAEAGDLVIGLGNSLRGDDGVGCWLAERAGRWRPSPQVLTVQQLTPELAEPLARARRVLFVDAWLGPLPGEAEAAAVIGLPPAKPWLQCLQPAAEATTADPAAPHPSGAFSHQLPPSELLAITALLYGRVPPAWLLLVPGFRFAHGDGLSRPLQRLLPAAERLLRQWWEQQPAGHCHA